MSKKPTPPAAADNRVRALLDRYRCPVPFHVVRTRFLGNIASPDMTASPSTSDDADNAAGIQTPSAGLTSSAEDWASGFRRGVAL